MDRATKVDGASGESTGSEESMLTEGSQLAVDLSHGVRDSESLMSSTATVSSSLYEHIEENGRTYHKYRQGKYILPNDELEQNRLDLQHHLCKISLRDRLHFAPLKEETLKNALDIGTGTGIWAIEFAQKYPNTQIIGSDLSPIQPEFIPKNLTFEVDDFEDEWLYQRPFSYIHGRLLAFCFHDPISVFRKAYAALEPGGYFEMQDSCAPLRSIDNSIAETNMEKCWNMITLAASKIGVDVTATPKYKGMFEEVGFKDVKEVVVPWPIGTWAKSDFHKRIGAWYQKDLLMGIEGIVIKLFTKVLGMKKEEVEVFMKEVLKDIENESIHGYQPFYVVYGRKPLEGQEKNEELAKVNENMQT